MRYLHFLTIVIWFAVSCCLHQESFSTENHREVLEIIKKASPPAECPLPPPPPPPPSAECPLPRPPPKSSPRAPSSGLSAELKLAVRVIQKFKTKIYDPKGITKTWVGNNICKDKSKYIGFFCYKSPKDGKVRVVGLKFNEFNFGVTSTTLKDMIKQLRYLVIFHVNSNNFTGTLPAKIPNIQVLFELDLSNNKFTGTFPPAVLTGTNLSVIDLRYNGLTGPLPPKVFTLELDLLFLNNNNFTGNLPENLGTSPVLFLNLANNYFNGQIPKSIGQASDLREAILLNNTLSGCLPYEIGKLNKATAFDVSNNKLTGPIPQSFGCLAKMEQLVLSGNRLYGEVPENLCKLGNVNLFKLDLKSNYFSQVGPECRKLISKKVLNLKMNCVLDLPSQRSKAECNAFFSKKLICPNMASFSYIPCDIKQLASEKKADAVAPSPSYAALLLP